MDRDAQSTLEAKIRHSLADADPDGAVRLILEGYGPEIFTYLLRSLRNEADASDVFSQFCENLWRGIGSFRERSSCRTWLFRLATNARADFWRNPNRRRERRLQTNEISKLEQRVRTTTLGSLGGRVEDRFARLRAALDRDEQSLLELRVEKEMGWLEIAEVLSGTDDGISDHELKARAATLRQRYKRLKDKIREMAREEGLLEQR